MSKAHLEVKKSGYSKTSIARRNKSDRSNKSVSSVSSIPVPVERRSGLQDVDDNYYFRLVKQNLYAKPFHRPQITRDEEETVKPNVKEAKSSPKTTEVMPYKQHTIASKLKVREAKSSTRSAAKKSESKVVKPASSARLKAGNIPKQPSWMKFVWHKNDKISRSPSSSTQGSLSNRSKNKDELSMSPSTAHKFTKHTIDVFIPIEGKPEICTTCPKCRTMFSLVRAAVDMPSERAIDEKSLSAISQRSQGANSPKSQGVNRSKPQTSYRRLK